MNNEYKRVEVEITDYDETVLLWNDSTYNEPYIMISFMNINNLGEIHWLDYEDTKRLQTEFDETDYKEILKIHNIINKHKYSLYDNPDKEFQIEGVKLKTIGISNTYRYNQ